MAHGRNLHRPRSIVLAAMAFLAAAALVLVGTQGAGAGTTPAVAGSGRGQTVETTINLPALVLDNLCNLDVVNLSGDLHIRTTTTPTRNGGYTVQSSAIARDLRGNRIAPLPPIRYRGDDGSNTFSYYAPPPYPSTHRVVHWTRLIPEANAPSMYLVLVLRETILADGTVVPVFERAFLVCKKPSCSSKHIKSSH
jgi:hypothetical protein